jgi:hypothetical protein
MKKQVIRKIKRSLSVAAMLGLGIAATSSTAMAVELDNNNRLGDAGIFQYYTATGDWQTFIRVINTSENAVAVKIRFREAANSREVFDYTVFLSPYDVWSGWTDSNVWGAADLADAVPGVRTNDTSCLYPLPDNNNQNEGWQTINAALNLKGAEFQSRSFTDNINPIRPYDDGGNVAHTVKERLSEGHIEVIGIGQYVPLGAFGIAVTHGDNGKPNDCTTAVKHYESNNLLPSLSYGFDLDNVLAMNGYLVNVDQGMGGGFDPDILTDFWSCPHYMGPIECHFIFGSLQTAALETATNPDMDSAMNPYLGPYGGLNEKRLKQKGIKMATNPGPEPVMGGVDQVSFALMRETVINEWAASNNAGSVISDYYTQWVLTFPTKHYYVDIQDDLYWDDDVSPTLYYNVKGPMSGYGYRPFYESFGADGACEDYYVYVWNREERMSDFASPAPKFPVDLCYETNVVVFNEFYENTGLNSAFSVTIPSGKLPTDVIPGGGSVTSERGWAAMDFFNYYRYLDYNPETICEVDAVDECRYDFQRYGLPVTGFMLSVYNTNDTLTNHAAINSHAYQVTDMHHGDMNGEPQAEE